VLPDWLERHTSRAPAALRARVLEHLLAVGDSADSPSAFAEAGRHALDRVVTHPGDRSIALDLLAADALITLALLAQSETTPERLGEFATALLQQGRSPA
jgi:hypothetical protein